MLGDTLTITLDGSGGTAKVLPKINQDGYSAEYFLDEGLVTYRAKVKHSKDTVKGTDHPRDRHTVSFEYYLKPALTAGVNVPGRKHTVTFTIVNESDGETLSDIIDLSEAMSFYMVKAGGIAAKLIGWES